MKENKGITLIVLAITVIILIILAGISINMVVGENGLFTKAEQVKENMQIAANEEQEELASLENEMEDQLIEENHPLAKDTLKMGNYVKYNTGDTSVGENGVIMCRVLYDASSQYGVQIISAGSIKDVTLGGSDWRSASASYNNAITTLNSEAEKYLNATYAVDARCVGSNPTIGGEGKMINKNAENEGPVVLQFSSSVSGANLMKEADANYEIDYNTMKTLGINSINNYYWLASRGVGPSASNCYFYIRGVDYYGELTNHRLCDVYSDGGSEGILDASGFRACFSLRSDVKIIDGDGISEETAYILGK